MFHLNILYGLVLEDERIVANKWHKFLLARCSSYHSLNDDEGLEETQNRVTIKRKELISPLV